jgi:hypothetical protein
VLVAGRVVLIVTTGAKLAIENLRAELGGDGVQLLRRDGGAVRHLHGTVHRIVNFERAGVGDVKVPTGSSVILQNPQVADEVTLFVDEQRKQEAVTLVLCMFRLKSVW